MACEICGNQITKLIFPACVAYYKFKNFLEINSDPLVGFKETTVKEEKYYIKKIEKRNLEYCEKCNKESLSEILSLLRIFIIVFMLSSLLAFLGIHIFCEESIKSTGSILNTVLSNAGFVCIFISFISFCFFVAYLVLLFMTRRRLCEYTITKKKKKGDIGVIEQEYLNPAKITKHKKRNVDMEGIIFLSDREMDLLHKYKRISRGSKYFRKVFYINKNTEIVSDEGVAQFQGKQNCPN